MAQIDTMESWLSNHIKSGNLQTNNTVMLDIGAYQGDFTKQLLSCSEIKKAILFEPNQHNYSKLVSSFAGNDQVDLMHFAVGDKAGDIMFNCDSDLATGSILPYQFRPNVEEAVQEQWVKLITLDHYFSQQPLSERISLIKIDTQGNDLAVLKGAENLLAEHQPWLTVELIFVPLYQDQAHPHAIIQWLAERGYAQAGLFNMHYTTDGWLAFADGVFVPQAMMQSFQTPFLMNYTNAQLMTENAMLREACEERLQLIHRLHTHPLRSKLSKLKNWLRA